MGKISKAVTRVKREDGGGAVAGAGLCQLWVEVNKDKIEIPSFVLHVKRSNPSWS